MRIFHVATEADWRRALETGAYTTSTRGRTLAQEGFIHASRREQVGGVLSTFYADVDEPLVVLEIETDLLDVPWREETVEGGETFPHVYGVLRPPAVVGWRPVRQPESPAPGPTSRRRVEPGPGQESVWDYPRPPRVEPSTELVEVRCGGEVVARTSASLRVLETSHPPVYYLPETAWADGVLRPATGTTYCEWKGTATYFDVVTRTRTASGAAWTYPSPTPGFEALVGHVAVMPALMDSCTVDGEVVTPQQGGFYGGWITSRVVGPFKGGPGTRGW
jgi:uncharacterized protein (DUF427 family)/uncharacterized protein (DUF952 family)